MDSDKAEMLEQMVRKLDVLIGEFDEFEPHNIAGVLLSRVVFLMSSDPVTGKGLVRYVWERLDEIEQNSPGSIL